MNNPRQSSASPADQTHVEEVEIVGHIIDSLILPKVLDTITGNGGTFRITKITVGQARQDPSFALIEVRANSAELLEQILAQIADHGAVRTTTQDCRLVPADMDGAFPEGFYSSTNQRTEVRIERPVDRGGRSGNGLRRSSSIWSTSRPAACR